MKFKNMKIAITDEVQLKAVCGVLESMGYFNEKEFNTKCDKIGQVLTWDDGAYHLQKGGGGLICTQATLTDLLAMRDKQFMEKVNAK